MLCFACGINPIAEGWGYFCGKGCAVSYANAAAEERGPVWCETERCWIEQGQDVITGLIGDALNCQRQGHVLVTLDHGAHELPSAEASSVPQKAPTEEADDEENALPF